MLVVNGFFENGIFTPEKQPIDIKGRQKAVLSIIDEDDKQERLKAWREFSQAIQASDEILEGEPQRMSFRNPEELNAL
jgi:predicted DNA-binding antitoxin AbrB/MazE fold protein